MENECCICNNKLTMETIVNTSCGHTFCKDCCFSWLHENPTCALCRTRFIKTKEEELTEKAQELRDECREIEEYKDLIISQIENEKEKYKEIYDNHTEMLKTTYEKMKNYKSAIKELKIVYEFEEKNLEKLQSDIIEVKEKIGIFKEDNKVLLRANDTLIKTNDNFKKINNNFKKTNEELHKTNEDLQKTNNNLQKTNNNLERINNNLKLTNMNLQKANVLLTNDNNIFDKEKKRKQHIKDEYLKDWNKLYSNNIYTSTTHLRSMGFNKNTNHTKNTKYRRYRKTFLNFNFL